MADQNELWPVEHNWRKRWSESHEFKTETITSRDQTEQRRALRALHRVSYRFLSTLRDDMAPARTARLSARQAQSFVIPHARLSTGLTVTISAGTAAFTLDSDVDWGQIGLDLVFVRPDKTMEWGRILTYSAGVGTLEDNVLVDIPAGSTVRHGIRGRFNKATLLRFRTNYVGEMDADFLAEPGNVYRLPSGADTEIYNTRPVWQLKPNWSRGPEVRWDQFQDVLDVGFGVRGYVDPVDYVARRTNAQYLLTDSTSQDELYGFFIRRFGKRESFYMPSWIREFFATAITTTTLTVAGLETSELFSADPVHRHVVLFLKDGTRVYAEVASVAPVAGESVITFVASIAAIVFTDIIFTTWLLPCRFASDKLEFTWVTNTVAPVTIPVQTIRDDILSGV